MTTDTRSAAEDLCRFVDASPTPWHAVAEAARRLGEAGYLPLDEREPWEMRAGQGYYVVRGGTSLIALRPGEDAPEQAGFSIVGAHTDSPNLRLKPRAPFSRAGYAMLGVEVYGGVLNHTWLDRDLGVAGRLMVSADGEPGGVASRLVTLRQPMCRVSSLAIHLDREVNDKGLVLNRQQHLPPTFGLAGSDAVAGERFMAKVASSAGIEPGDLLGHDLMLFDLLPSTLGGLEEELVFAPRLDNLASCHAALTALLGAPQGRRTAVAALFDHEEIGSTSTQGAASSFLRDVLTRVVQARGQGGAHAVERALAHSFNISADMAHAVHPNYADRHEPAHMPRLGAGPVVKTNSNVRYATDGESAARFRALCRRAEVPCQDFVTRTDLACGSTIGPITASALGLRTVDVGNPMLSMHSLRELCGTADVALMARVLRQHYAE